MKLLLKTTSVFQKNAQGRVHKALHKCRYMLCMDTMFFPKASKLANSLQITTVDASSCSGRQCEIKDDGPQKRLTKLEIGELVN